MFKQKLDSGLERGNESLPQDASNLPRSVDYKSEAKQSTACQQPTPLVVKKATDADRRPRCV